MFYVYGRKPTRIRVANMRIKCIHYTLFIVSLIVDKKSDLHLMIRAFCTNSYIHVLNHSFGHSFGNIKTKLSVFSVILLGLSIIKIGSVSTPTYIMLHAMVCLTCFIVCGNWSIFILTFYFQLHSVVLLKYITKTTILDICMYIKRFIHI